MLQIALGPMLFNISRSRKTPSTFSEKPNVYLIILEAILRFGLQNDQNSTGFIRNSDQLFSMPQNASTNLGPMLFLTFRKVAKRHQLLVKSLMLF